MTQAINTPPGLPPLDARGAKALRTAARLWIAAQALFLLATIGYALIDPVPREFPGWWWLWFAAGSRFTTVATGVCSIAVCILCAAIWSWASWKLGGIDGNINPFISRVVRWGGLAFLLIAEPLQRVLSRGELETPPSVDQAVRTLEVLLCLAIAVHLRIVVRRFQDRPLNLTAGLLMLVVGLNLLAFAPFWLSLQPPRTVFYLILALPIARALAFLAVMTRVLAVVAAPR
jgi:hypothetical protein